MERPGAGAGERGRRRLGLCEVEKEEGLASSAKAETGATSVGQPACVCLLQRACFRFGRSRFLERDGQQTEACHWGVLERVQRLAMRWFVRFLYNGDTWATHGCSHVFHTPARRTHDRLSRSSKDVPSERQTDALSSHVGRLFSGVLVDGCDSNPRKHRTFLVLAVNGGWCANSKAFDVLRWRGGGC